MPGEPIDTNSAPCQTNALDNLTARLAQIVQEMEGLGLEYAELKIAEAIDIIESSNPNF